MFFSLWLWKNCFWESGHHNRWAGWADFCIFLKLPFGINLQKMPLSILLPRFFGSRGELCCELLPLKLFPWGHINKAESCGLLHIHIPGVGSWVFVIPQYTNVGRISMIVLILWDSLSCMIDDIYKLRSEMVRSFEDTLLCSMWKCLYYLF